MTPQNAWRCSFTVDKQGILSSTEDIHIITILFQISDLCIVFIKYEGRELYRDQKYVSKYWTENERGHVRYMYMYIHIFNEFNLKNNLKEYRKGMGVVVLRNPRTHTIDHNISFSAKGPKERYKKNKKNKKIW